MKISDKEQNDIAFAAGVILAATEMLLEGRIIDANGEKMLKKANDIIEKYNVSFEELIIYIKAIAQDEMQNKVNDILDRRVFHKSRYKARKSFKAGAH